LPRTLGCYQFARQPCNDRRNQSEAVPLARTRFEIEINDVRTTLAGGTLSAFGGWAARHPGFGRKKVAEPWALTV
jgi:hypothetical protein